MTVHLIKLAVGIEDIDHLRRIQERRLADHGMVFHLTRMVPKRADELAARGSIYWVIRGVVQCRQGILAVHEETDGEGRRRCRLELDPLLVPVRREPCKAFQGWRYLAPEQAPPDVADGSDDLADMPPDMYAALKELGLI